MTDHLDIRKIGFTGSTGVGKTIMKRYVCRVGREDGVCEREGRREGGREGSSR